MYFDFWLDFPKQQTFTALFSFSNNGIFLIIKKQLKSNYCLFLYKRTKRTQVHLMLFSKFKVCCNKKKTFTFLDFRDA